MTLVELATAAGALLTSAGAGGAITAWVKGRGDRAKAAAEGEAQVGVAAMIRDQTIAGELIRRIKDLETRCDVLSDGIAAAHRETEECREGRAECERRTKDLEARVVDAEDLVERLRDQFARVELRLTSTPPGSWRLDEDEIERLTDEEDRRED